MTSPVRLCVVTLTRDRLAYSRHCFERLRERCGRPYHHYVLDQGSKDGTEEWLYGELVTHRVHWATHLHENIGCTRGWNRLLEEVLPQGYDAVVCFDNDCEVVTPDILRVAELAVEHEQILSPQVLGLMHPPPTIGTTNLGGYVVDVKPIIGNIFMAIPTVLFTRDGFRWDEHAYQVWDGGESITQWWRQRGGLCGYVQAFQVNHYLTTQGQVADIPWYFERRVTEGGRAA